MDTQHFRNSAGKIIIQFYSKSKVKRINELKFPHSYRRFTAESLVLPRYFTFPSGKNANKLVKGEFYQISYICI
jgi:hypothetical protein